MTKELALKIITNLALCQRKFKESGCKHTECPQCYFNYRGTSDEQLEALFMLIELVKKS